MALENLLQQIDFLKEEVDALRPIDTPKIEKLNAKLRLEWTYHSNAIEGNTLTLSETRVLLQQGIHMGNKLGRHYEEMKLHEDVLFALEDIVHQKRPVTEVLIRQLHEQLMGNDYFVDAIDSLNVPQKVKGRPGAYKNTTNGVKRIVNGREIFVSFKTPDEVRVEMPELIAWYLAEEEKQELHPVERAAILHYRFVSLHPFDDGNGRMGRILMNLALMRAGYVAAIVRIEERERYIRNLAIAQDGGELTPFVELVAEETLRSMELLVKAAKGESIEEPDDIDKEIAIWKRTLNTNNNKTIAVNDKRAIPELYISSLKNLLKLFEAKAITNFAGLFASNKTKYTLQKSKGTFETTQLNFVDDEFLNFVAEGGLAPIYQLNVEVFFKDFKSGNNVFFNTTMALIIEFHDYQYRILSDRLNAIVEKPYTEILSEEEQRAIVSDIVKVTFAQIRMQIQQH